MSEQEFAKPGLKPGTPPKPKSSGGKAFIVFTVIILVLAGLGWLIQYRLTNAGAKSGGGAGRGGAGRGGADLAVPVIAGRVAQKDVPIYLDGLGTVQAFNTVTIHTRVDGQLVKIAFTEGQDVKTGDLLAQIDPDPYQAALEQAQAKKEQDAAQLANATLDLKRYSDLLATDGTTQQTYDTQKALVDQFAAAVKADQAAVASAQVNLDYTTIRSPIDGRVGIRLVDQGNIVHASDANGLVVLTQLRPISIIFTLPETTVSRLHAGQAETNFTVLAMSRDGTNVLATGQLAVIDNQIDTTTGTIKLKATFANENLRLWPGAFVNTRLLLTVRKDSAVVPASVVQRGPEGAFAFVIQDDQTVAMRPLKVGQMDGGEALIEEGLQPGETVVVDGQYKLQDGSHVQASWAATNGNANAPATAPKKLHQHKKPA